MAKAPNFFEATAVTGLSASPGNGSTPRVAITPIGGGSRPPAADISDEDDHDQRPTVEAAAPNPFDPDRLRLPQNFAETAGVQKLLLTVPVRKPQKQDFVRVHSDPKFRLSPAAIIELKEDREVYLVDPEMAVQLPGEFTQAVLYTAISRQGVLFIWPVRLPDEGQRRVMEWHRSAGEAAGRAMKAWVRVMPNMSLGAYEVFLAAGPLPEPEWPTLSFVEILEVAFRDRLIRSADHPVIQQLRGAV